VKQNTFAGSWPDWTERQRVAFQFITHLLHPAVLGGMLIHLLSRALGAGALSMPWYAGSLGGALIVYSALDFLVTISNFQVPNVQDVQSRSSRSPGTYKGRSRPYSAAFFWIDAASLFLTYAAFWSLIERGSFSVFFGLVAASLLLVLLWTVKYFGTAKRKVIRYCLVSLPCLAVAVLGVVLSVQATPFPARWFQYLSLGAFGIALLIYIVDVLAEPTEPGEAEVG